MDAKYRSRNVITVRMPVIFVSNMCPYSDPAFLRRLEVINALGKMENFPKIKVPKQEEVDGMETEVVEIASEDENSDDEAKNEQMETQVVSKEKVLEERKSRKGICTETFTNESNILQG